MIQGPSFCPPKTSGLTLNASALLEVIVIRLATTRESIDEYAKKSLFHHSNGLSETISCVDSSLLELERMEFIQYHEDGSAYVATQLGKAVVASSIDPEDGLFVYGELKGALKAFVMDGDMHVIYTFTPVSATDILVNWKVFLDMVETLDESGHRVMNLLGIKIPLIVRM